MGEKKVPKTMIIGICFFVFLTGVFILNNWVSKEVSQTGEGNQPSIVASKGVATEASNVAPNIVKEQEGLARDIKKDVPVSTEEDTEKNNDQEIIYEIPLDNHILLQ